VGTKKIRKKKRRRSGPEKRQAMMKRLARRAKESDFIMIEDSEFVGETLERVSELIEELAEPWLEFIEDDDQGKGIIELAMIAWNIALLPEDEIEDNIAWFIDEMQVEDPADCVLIEMMLVGLIERKLMLFPDVRRYIVDYEMVVVDDTLQLVVASTVSPNTADPG